MSSHIPEELHEREAIAMLLGNSSTDYVGRGADQRSVPFIERGKDRQ